jgi:proline dehydrogenase
MMVRSIVLRVAGLGFVERIVKKSFLFRPLLKRFIAGDSLDHGMAASEALLERGFMVSLDLLGENVASLDEVARAKASYIEMLHRVAKSPHFRPYELSADSPPKYSQVESLNISIKLTQCGFDQSDELALNNYREVLAIARDYRTFVRVDMEGSPYTERTVKIIEDVIGEFPNSGTVLQAYMFRTPDDLSRLMKLGARIRLVKGAYFEPANLAYPSKADVDKSYVELAKKMLREAHYSAIATHDPRILEELKSFVRESKIDLNSFEFQMIYGIRRDLQDALLSEGFRVRVYVPFGKSWYPYFSRRLAERPANMWFIFKSLFKG